MRKIVVSFVAVCMLLLSAPLSAQAEEFSGGDGWRVEFNGRKMESTFKSTDIDDVIYQLQPGDTVNLHLELKNSYEEETNWYMSNKVLQSLEDSQRVANGGAYSYILTYIEPDGTKRLLYSSESVGGDTINESGEGLHQATDSLEDFFYLDRLTSGENAEIILTVKLEGETQGNEYQNTLAKLQMNFAVERMGRDASPLFPQMTKLVKTGDTTNILIFVAMTLIAGMVCVVLAVIAGKKKGKEKR